MSIRIKQGDKWVEVKVPILTDSSLSMDGQAADAKEVGDRFNSTNERLNNLTESLANNDQSIEQMMNVVDNLPVRVSTDGYTDVLNTRIPTDISIKEVIGYIDGSSDVEINMTLQGQKKLLARMSFDKNDRPFNLKISKEYCPINWLSEKVPSVDAGTNEQELLTYIVQNGAINTNVFGEEEYILDRGFPEDTVHQCNVIRVENYLQFSHGSIIDAGSAANGVRNRIGFKLKKAFDFTNYDKLKIDVNYINYAPTYLRVTKVGESSYTEIQIVSQDTGSSFSKEVDISNLTGSYFIEIFARTTNTYNDNMIRITNLYLTGKITSIVPDILYFVGPSGFDTNTFGELSGSRWGRGNSSFYMEWNSGHNGDYSSGAYSSVTHANYVNLSEYKTMKIVMNKTDNSTIDFGADTLKLYFKSKTTGESVYSHDLLKDGLTLNNIQWLVSTYGENFKLQFSGDFKNHGVKYTFTEVSFSKE